MRKVTAGEQAYLATARVSIEIQAARAVCSFAGEVRGTHSFAKGAKGWPTLGFVTILIHKFRRKTGAMDASAAPACRASTYNVCRGARGSHLIAKNANTGI